MQISRVLFAWWVRPGRTRTLYAGGRRRRYLVHFPIGHRRNTQSPVVIALHGATMNGSMMAWFTGLNRTANQSGFIVVYPNGTGRHASYSWNAGNCCGYAKEHGVDDVAFFRILLDDLVQTLNVDPRRIYVTGMSNGAIMAYRLAAELSDRIAAIAPVSGPLGVQVQQVKRPVPVLHFHGTDDQYTPFLGCKKGISGFEMFSVEHSIQTWVKLNGCQTKLPTEILDESTHDMRITRTTYTSGSHGSEVVLIVIEGGGHTWPGKQSLARSLGRSTLAISANDLMWQFFMKHPLTSPADAIP